MGREKEKLFLFLTQEMGAKTPFNFFFFAILELELRVSCLLGRCSTTWATPPASLFLMCGNQET
jgi:hypothetical protein